MRHLNPALWINFRRMTKENSGLIAHVRYHMTTQPRSQGLLRFQDGDREKTLAHTVIPPASIEAFCLRMLSGGSFNLKNRWYAPAPRVRVHQVSEM